MKIGSVDGTPEEIRGLLENNGLRLDDYLDKPEAPLENKWIYVPVSLFLVWLLLMVVASPMTGKGLLLMFLGGSAFAVWLTFAVQIRFKNGGATSVVAVGTLVLLLVAGGFIAPVETLEAIKKAKNG